MRRRVLGRSFIITIYITGHSGFVKWQDPASPAVFVLQAAILKSEMLFSYRRCHHKNLWRRHQKGKISSMQRFCIRCPEILSVSSDIWISFIFAKSDLQIKHHIFWPLLDNYFLCLPVRFNKRLAVAFMCEFWLAESLELRDRSLQFPKRFWIVRFHNGAGLA